MGTLKKVRKFAARDAGDFSEESAENSWLDEERKRESVLPSHTNAFGHFPKGNVEMLKCLNRDD